MSTDPLLPHSHDPNPDPPSLDPSILFIHKDNRKLDLTTAYLAALPQTELSECYIVSTGHGTSGPFCFGGPTLLTLLTKLQVTQDDWESLEVLSEDGFGTRIYECEVMPSKAERPILLALQLDGQPLSRQDGLVRLIVPSEVDDALKQVKWISEIRVR